MVALPRGHEAHRLAIQLHQAAGVGAGASVDQQDLTHPSDRDDQHHEPENQSHGLIDHRCGHGTRQERRPAAVEEPDGNEP